MIMIISQSERKGERARHQRNKSKDILINIDLMLSIFINKRNFYESVPSTKK